MVKKLQWEIEMSINAPLEKVWDAMDDLTLIPQYHPDVKTVEYVSGQTKRAVGVSYKCIVPEGRKGWCIERVIEHIPYQKTSVDFPEDSWGMSRMFADFVTEIRVRPGANNTTVVQLVAYYVPKGIMAYLMNILFMRRFMRKRAMLTVTGFKRLIEGRS